MSKAKDDAVKRTTTEAVKKEDSNVKKPFFQRVKQWFRDLGSELKKVVWPTRSQVVNNTLVSLAVMIASAIVIWGFDTLAQMGVKTLISLV